MIQKKIYPELFHPVLTLHQKNVNCRILLAFYTEFGSSRCQPLLSKRPSTDKRTDVWSRDFMIWLWIVNFGLWAVAWAGLWEKRVWDNYEQLLRHVFSLFRGQKKILKFFENTQATALKRYIILFLQNIFLLIF